MDFNQLEARFWMRRINEACRFKNRRIDPYLNLRSNFPVLNQVFEEIHTDVCGIPRSISALGDHRFWHPFWVLNRFFTGNQTKIYKDVPLWFHPTCWKIHHWVRCFFLTSNQFLGHFPAMFDMFDEARGIQRPIFSAMGWPMTFLFLLGGELATEKVSGLAKPQWLTWDKERVNPLKKLGWTKPLTIRG